MQIDPFTLIAQIVNFVLLLLLLRYFLYDPVVEAMDEREQRIARRLQEAEETQQQAEQAEEQYRQKRQELASREQALLDEARQEAQQRREELLEQARQEVEATQERWQESVERQQETFKKELRRRIAQQTDQVARRVLGDLADVELERRMVELFSQRLRDVTDQDRETIAQSIRQAGNRARIRSAFHLPDEARRQLRQVVQEHFLEGDHLEVTFERSPELICGAELQTDGRRIAWTAKHYLDAVEEKVVQSLIRSESQPDEERDEPQD